MRRRRSFTLVEVLVSMLLFSTVLSFIMAPLRCAASTMKKESEYLMAQSAIEEAIHKLHVHLFQKEQPSWEDITALFKDQEVNSFWISYRVNKQDSLSQGSSQVFELAIDVSAKKRPDTADIALRRVLVCVKAA